MQGLQMKYRDDRAEGRITFEAWDGQNISGPDFLAKRLGSFQHRKEQKRRKTNKQTTTTTTGVPEGDGMGVIHKSAAATI